MIPIPIMIDSGAFSAHTRGVKINLKRYIRFCKETEEHFPNAVFVNLDVIGDGEASYQNWRRMRKAGVKALPVFHATTPIRFLDLYMKETDHIGLGALAKMSGPRRIAILDEIWDQRLVDAITRMPIVKVHGMGVTSFRLMARYPWHSVDSTSWLKISRCGTIFLPKRKGGSWDFSRAPQQIGVSVWEENSARGTGRFYSNLSPHEQRLLREYLKSLGLRLGFRCKLEEGGRALLRGVSTYYGDRDKATMDAFARFLEHLPWPRPFTRVSARGFGL